MTRYPLFDVIRLILALEVVRLHFGRPWSKAELFPAVAGFLAISGFCILQSYERSSGWPHFAWKRVCRIVPAFVMMLGLGCVAAGWPYVASTLTLWASLGFSEHRTANAPVWSLGWEELYYGLLAVLFTVGAYQKRWPIWALAAVSLMIGCGLSIYAAAGPWQNSDLLKHLVRIAPLGVSFFIGNLAYIYKDWMKKHGLLLALLLLPVPFMSFPFDWRALQAVLFAVGLLALGIRFVPKLPKFPDLSYSVYVYHSPVLILAGKNAPMALVLLLPVSLASWFLIEKPALTLKDWRPRRKAVEWPALAGDSQA